MFCRRIVRANMYVCMYVCVYVCMYICMYVCMYVYVLCVCKYVCMYVCMCVYVCIMYVLMYVCVCMYVCVYVCMCVCMCVYVYNACPKAVHSSLISLCAHWGRCNLADCISKVKVTLPYKIHNQTERVKQDKFPALHKHHTLLAGYSVIWMLTKTEIILFAVDH